jgi:tRNA nucleotidyltransferase (CCA-adding enzyme)
MKERGSAFIFLKTGLFKGVPDVIWGQLYKFKKNLRKIIRHHGFTFLRDDIWSDEKKTTIFIFELKSRFIPKVEHHIGPPLNKNKECKKFLEKYLKKNITKSGPRIEENHWVVERLRKHYDVVDLLRTKIKDNDKNLGTPNNLIEALNSFKVLINDEVKNYYLQDHNFASFLTNHLKGTSTWLR